MLFCARKMGAAMGDISRWSNGARTPNSSAQTAIARLHCVVDRLSDVYAPNDVRSWLRSAHPQLGGAGAIDFIGAGGTEVAPAIIEQRYAGAFAWGSQH